MKKKRKAVCFVCGGSARHITFFQGYKGLCCNLCNLEWRWPLPEDKKLIDIYKKGYFSQEGRIQRGYPDYEMFERSFVRYFVSKLDQIENQVTSRGLLVDVGCGPGTFLNLAKKRRYKVIGVDVSSEAVRKAKKKHGIRVWQGLFEDINFSSSSLDVVTCFQTFEHMRYPLRFLRAVNKALKPSGMLFLTTPNRQTFWRRMLGKRWFSYKHKDHLFFWQRKCLDIAFAKAGFEDRRFFSDDWRFYSLKELAVLIDAYAVSLNAVISQKWLEEVLDKIQVPFPVGSIGVIAKK